MRIPSILTAAALGVLGYARWIEPKQVKVHRHSVELPNWPASLNGLRIGFASDFHVDDSGANLPVVNQAIDIFEREKPDIILLGGDFFDKGRRVSIEPFWTRLPNVAPVISVLGNHDYHGGDDESERIAQALQRHRIRVLKNESCSIELPRGTLNLIAVDDPYSGRADFGAATASGRNVDHPTILLSHAGMIIDQIPAGAADLVLTGHTHGGQMRISPTKYTSPLDPFWWLDRIKKQRLSHYREGFFWQNGMLLFVSTGLGTTTLKLRLLAPPEVNIFEISRGNGDERFACDEARRWVHSSYRE
jgi:uncharacterized protein